MARKLQKIVWSFRIEVSILQLVGFLESFFKFNIHIHCCVVWYYNVEWSNPVSFWYMCIVEILWMVATVMEYILSLKKQKKSQT